MVTEIYSKIDSDRFGIKVGKVIEEFFYNKNTEDVIEYFFQEKYDLILARVDIKEIHFINELEKFGFTFKDAQSTLFYQLKDKTKADLPKKFSQFNIREFRDSDTEIFVELARTSFDGYGHYFVDKKLNHSDCLDTYGDWAYNTCINPKIADKIFVAELNGEIIGYLSFKIHEENGKKFAVGGMGAVHSKYRSLGVFRDITIAGLEWGIDNGLDWEEHNVLASNFPVNKSFIKLGFKPEKFVITLHGWINELKRKI